MEDAFKKVPILGGIISWMSGNGMDYGPFVAIVSLGLFCLGLFVFGVSWAQIFSVFIFLMPIWLPLCLFFIFFNKWMDTIGKAFYLYNGRTTLRINLPPEVQKSPEAMEVVLAQIHNVASADNLMQVYLDGKRPLTYALEIVSIGGEVRFYINTPTKKTKNALEAAMYSQYPGVEVVEELVDYAAEIPMDLEGYEAMSFHMGKKDDQAFPIKTYVDYKLDQMPKEEEKLDPLTPMLELLGTVKSYERVYVQLVIVPHRKYDFDSGTLTTQPSWEKEALKKVDEILKRDPKTKAPLTSEGSDFEGSPRISPGERETIEAIERNTSKYAYETNIRWIYITKPGHFNGDFIGPMIRTFSQHDMIGRNQIGVRWRTDFDYMKISDPTGQRVLGLKRQELKEFKLRKFFPKNGGGVPKIFTVEELASVFHLPGKVALTPTLTRIPSARSEAPSNLPIGDQPQ